MTRRLVLTPAIGLFTGLSMASFGAMGVFLTGAHGSAQATNACTAASTALHAPAAVHAGDARSGARYVGGTHAPAATHFTPLDPPIAAHVAAIHVPAATQALPAATQASSAAQSAILHAPAAAHVSAAHTTAFEARSGLSRSGAPARAAGHAVLLDAAAQRVSAGRAAKHHSTDTASAATTGPTPPVSTGSPGAVSPSPPTPDPSPGGEVTPSPGNSAPDPGSSGNATPGTQSGPTPPVSSSGGEKTPTASASSTPTPTPTKTTTTSPPGTLCVSVQTIGGSNTVKPDSTVQVAIWVWLTSGKGGTATVELGASPTDIHPTFSVCQPTGGATCSVSGLKAGHKVELEAALKAASDLAGHDVTLTVTATSHQASNTASAKDEIKVESKPAPKKHHSSPTPTPTPTTPYAGDGGTVPPYSYSGGSGSYPGVSNPTGNLGSDFPQVSPSPGVSPTTSQNRHGRQVELTGLSAALPLDVRLIGGQVVGLAILAAAVTIAVARLSLRKQSPKHSDDSPSS